MRDCDGNRRLVRVRDYFKAGKEETSCFVPSQFLMIFTGARPTGYVGKYITKEADVRFS